MFILKSDIVTFDALPEVLDCLPPAVFSLSRDETLALWQQWHRDGSLQMGRVERVMADGSRQMQAVGITVWITDAAVEALSNQAAGGCTHRLYQAAKQGQPWIMDTNEIHAAHASDTLNLMVLHYWSRGDVTNPDFQPVFLQSHMLFRDLHQGFGVKALYQEVTVVEKPFLTSAGMDVIHSGPDSDPAAQVWMGVTREQAMARSGCTFSFLFFSPPRRLALQPAVQRMLALAVRQMTDEDIAAALGCSRDYVRKLWSHAYDSMERTGVLPAAEADPAGTGMPVRGRERRRNAIEFMRANQHEMRPGLPPSRKAMAESLA